MSDRKQSKAVCMAVIAVFAILLLSTGCKKDDDPVIIVQPDVGGTMYYAVENYGDMFKFQLNTTTEEYSYLQLEGPVPIGVGQGALTHQTGLGTYAYKDADPGDDTMYVAIPDELVVVGGYDVIAAGVPAISTSYTPASIMGMYNYISFEYELATDDTDVSYGTLLIENGTWKLYMLTDGTTYPASQLADGNWIDRGNGIIDIHCNQFGGLRIGSVVVFPSPAGDNILIMNTIASDAKGIFFGVPQQTLTSGNYDGTYDSIDWENTDFDEVVISGTTLTVNGGGMPAMTYNSPWDGFVTFGDSYVLPGNNGFFAGIGFTAPPADDGGMFIGVIR